MTSSSALHTFDITFSCGTTTTLEATAASVKSLAAAWSAEHGHGVVTYIRAL